MGGLQGLLTMPRDVAREFEDMGFVPAEALETRKRKRKAEHDAWRERVIRETFERLGIEPVECE